jgi:hypothetical protein
LLLVIIVGISLDNEGDGILLFVIDDDMLEKELVVLTELNLRIGSVE